MPSQTQTVVLPRGLIGLAWVWLVVSWIAVIGLRPPLEPSSASYTPGVRMMLLCATIGLMIGWPLLRLSQSRTPFPLRQTLLDLVVLLALVQVVVWPLRLVTPWSPARTAALDATIAGWTVLAGAAVAWSIRSPRGSLRSLAMLACIGMCLAGPAAGWLGVVSGVDAVRLVGLGPLMAIGTLTKGSGGPPTIDQWQWIGLLWLAAVAVWAALGVAAAVRARVSRAASSCAT